MAVEVVRYFHSLQIKIEYAIKPVFFSPLQHLNNFIASLLIKLGHQNVTPSIVFSNIN